MVSAGQGRSSYVSIGPLETMQLHHTLMLLAPLGKVARMVFTGDQQEWMIPGLLFVIMETIYVVMSAGAPRLRFAHLVNHLTG